MDKKYDIIIVSGGFDPLHKGHVRLFKAAKNNGHKVILGLNSDKWLVEKKGKAFMDWAERAEILRELRNIDEVISFNDSDGTALDLLSRVKQLYPELSIAFANGGEKKESTLPEAGFCSAYKIDLLFNMGGSKVQSSSDLINQVKE
jgi:cytidyltransferase-like protein